MRLIVATAILLSLACPAAAGGFSARNLSLDGLDALPGQDTGWGTDDWGETPSDPSDPFATEGAPPPVEKKRAGVAPGIRLGALVPFLSKGADYTGGFGIGVDCRIDLDARKKLWVRPGADFGFLSAEEDYWEADSTLLLIHIDGGIDLFRTDAVRGSAFLCLGCGLEFFSGAETVGLEQDFSETNVNLLGGAGASIGYLATPELALEAMLRLTFPLGSKNVQGLLLGGVSVSYRF